MLYMFFMKSYQGNSLPPTSKVLNNFVSTFCTKNDLAIALLGYMSTTKNTIDNFCTNLTLCPATYFLQGMNGINKVGGHQAINIQDYYNSHYNPIPFQIYNNGKDHSKMIFFLEGREDNGKRKSVFVKN